MSNQHLPEELLDLIVDLLHKEWRTLRKCCLISKSWILRARKHLFADIKLYGAKALQSWKTTFLDPSTSPACYVWILITICFPEIVTTGAEEDGCISTFTNVLDFGMVAPETDPSESPISLLPFYGFSPGLKTLRLAFPIVPPPQLFNLICSFPLLDDLHIVSFGGWSGSNKVSVDKAISIRSLVSPPFTGFLELDLKAGLDLVASRLLSLPGGLHFRRLRLMLNQEKDVVPVMALVEGCRSTLESLEIEHELSGLFICHLSAPITYLCS